MGTRHANGRLCSRLCLSVSLEGNPLLSVALVHSPHPTVFLGNKPKSKECLSVSLTQKLNLVAKITNRHSGSIHAISHTRTHIKKDQPFIIILLH